MIHERRDRQHHRHMRGLRGFFHRIRRTHPLSVGGFLPAARLPHITGTLLPAFRLLNQAPHDIHALLIQQIGCDIGLIEQQILCRIVQNQGIIKGQVVKYRFGGEIILGSDERNRYIKRKPIDHMGFLCLHTAGE